MAIPFAGESNIMTKIERVSKRKTPLFRKRSHVSNGIPALFTHPPIYTLRSRSIFGINIEQSALTWNQPTEKDTRKVQNRQRNRHQQHTSRIARR